MKFLEDEQLVRKKVKQGNMPLQTLAGGFSLPQYKIIAMFGSSTITVT